MGIWIRVSTDRQAASDSPEIHEHRARGYAEAKGWEVATVYQLAGVSGKDVRSQPECQRMLEDVASGKIQGLIFSKLARLARSTRDLLDFAEYFRSQDAALISLKESIDTSSHAGRFFYTMLAALAQFEREEVSSRVKEAVRTRAKMGKSIGGAAPFGYVWQDGLLALHPEESPVRALMYELFSKSERIKGVATQLNQQGYRTRRGRPWHASSVRVILMDSISKGLRRTNYTKMDPVTGAPKPRPREDWIFVEAPAVVSEELWASVNAVLDARIEQRRLRPGRPSKHLFTGLVSCADCKKKAYVRSRSACYRCQSCSNSIPCDDLEAIFLEKLRDWLTPGTVAAILLQADQVVQEQASLAESLSTQVAEVEAEIDQLFALHLKGELPTEGFRLRHEPLESRQVRLRAELARIEGQLASYRQELLSEEQALSDAEKLLKDLGSMDAELKRQTVQTLVSGITLGKEEIVLKLNYLPFPLPASATRVTTPTVSSARASSAVCATTGSATGTRKGPSSSCWSNARTAAGRRTRSLWTPASRSSFSSVRRVA